MDGDFVLDVEFYSSDEKNQDAWAQELDDVNGTETRSQPSDSNIGARIHFELSEGNTETRNHSESLGLSIGPGIDSESSELNVEAEAKIDFESAELNINTRIPPELILQCPICRIPRHVREEDERAYTPRIVSIGPFHYKKRGLEVMEARKLNFLRLMLEGNDKQDLLTSLRGAMKELESETRECYLEDFNTISSDEFVNMMVVDGCFLIELFRLTAKMCQGEDVNDPVFATQWNGRNLRLDLLLLENQLPSFVLHEIFRIAYSEDGSSLNRLALQFFESMRPCEDKMSIESCNIEGNHQHLLALFQSSFISSDYKPETSSSTSTHSNFSMGCWISNAEKLEQSNLILKRIPGNLLDMELQKSTLKIPTIFIDSRAKLLLRNLVAYEQSNSRAVPYFTSVVWLFYSLVHTPADSKLLQQKEIIRGTTRGGEEVVAFFSSLSKEIVLNPDNCLVKKQVTDINCYYSTFRARISRLYNRLFSEFNLFKFVLSAVFFFLSYNFVF